MNKRHDGVVYSVVVHNAGLRPCSNLRVYLENRIDDEECMNRISSLGPDREQTAVFVCIGADKYNYEQFIRDLNYIVEYEDEYGERVTCEYYYDPITKLFHRRKTEESK